MLADYKIAETFDEKEIKLNVSEIKEEKLALLTSLSQSAIHRALFFSDIPQLLELLEPESTDDSKQNTISTVFYRWVMENMPFRFEALDRLLLGQQVNQDATQNDINLLFICIMQNKPKLLKQLASLINTASIPPKIVAQFYYLVLHFKRYEFFDILQKANLLPPYTIIYLARRYNLSHELKQQLWGSLPRSAVPHALRLLFQHSPPGPIDTSSLPTYLQSDFKSFKENIFDNKEEKGFSPLELPILASSSERRNLKRLVELVNQEDYFSVFCEIDSARSALRSIREYGPTLLKELFLDEKIDSSPEIAKTVQLLRCVGSDLMTCHFILTDNDLRKDLAKQHRSLSLYFPNRQLLPTQWLADLLISNQPVEIAPLRRLIYLVEEEKKEELYLSVLDRETLSAEDYRKSMPFLKRLGGDAEKLAAELGLTHFQLSDDAFLPIVNFSKDIHSIIGEYLGVDDLRTAFPALLPQTMLQSQQHEIQTKIGIIQSLITELEALPGRQTRNNRLMILGYVVLLAAAIALFAHSHSVNSDNIEERSNIVSSPDWQPCQADGYYTVSSLDPNQPFTGSRECKTSLNYTQTEECDQFCDDYNDINFPWWLGLLNFFAGLGTVCPLIILPIIHLWQTQCCRVRLPLVVPSEMRDRINGFFDSAHITRPTESLRGLEMNTALSSLRAGKSTLTGRLKTTPPCQETTPLRHFSIVTESSGSIQQTPENPLETPLLRNWQSPD